MGFIEFNKDTGLLVKTKVNIAQDLKTMFKTAYGQDFEIVEGTELYSLVDSLSSQLAETGSAAKAIYDGYSFTSATGTTLDVMCSLAGISRRDNESDNSLRARYYTFLYSTSVGTVESLKARLLEHTYTDNNGLIQNSVEEVLIKNNKTPAAVNIGTSKNLEAHSAIVVCKLYSSIVEDTTEYNIICKELSDIVENNISLGCGIYTSSTDNVVIAQPQEHRFKVDLITSDLPNEYKPAVSELFKNKLVSYFDNLHIGESVLKSAFYKYLFDALNELQLLTSGNVGLSRIYYSVNELDTELPEVLTCTITKYIKASDIIVSF